MQNRAGNCIIQKLGSNLIQKHYNNIIGKKLNIKGANNEQIRIFYKW